MDKRRYPRYAVEYTASFLGNGINSPGIVFNLSTAGCRGSSEGLIRRDALLRVLIDVPRLSAPIHVDRAVVRWSSGNEFGLEFTGIPSDDEQRLQDLMSRPNRLSLSGGRVAALPKPEKNSFLRAEVWASFWKEHKAANATRLGP
jgi:PilZ domain